MIFQKAAQDERTLYVDYIRVEPNNDTRGEYIGTVLSLVDDGNGNYTVNAPNKTRQLDDAGWTLTDHVEHLYTVKRHTYRVVDPQTAKWIQINRRYNLGRVDYGEDRMEYHGFDWDDVKSIKGLTFDFKEQLKEMGFKFDKKLRGWVRK